MKTIFIILLFFFFACLNIHAQTVQTLNKLGQTPGGASAHVNWDIVGHKLIVGCGTSIWIYDFSNPFSPQIIAKRPFMGLVNETSLDGNILFAAVTHEGVFALDYTSPDLTILHHYDMKNMGDSAAYDLWRTNDTLYVADHKTVRMLKYNTASGFSKLASFSGPASYCVAQRGDYIAVGNKGTLLTEGNISVYSVYNLSVPIAVWSSAWLNVVQNVHFADLRDDIIYVCGGPENLLFTKSNLFALQFNGSTLNPIDTFFVDGGIPGLAQMNIMNMDSRNDTLFIVTTAAYDTASFPLAYMPIVDASGLPVDTMKKIGFVIPGLWHFDAALMHGTPYIAMASEWCGVLVSDVSQLSPYDTLGLYETGGWCVDAKVKNNLLWACHEGYGLIAYNIDSLQYSSGFNAQSKLMHIYDLNNHYFSSDLEFLNDTLLMINSSEVYNIKPWQMGGQPQLAYDMSKNWMNHLSIINTNTGQRMIATYDNLLGGKWIELFDPFNSINNFPVLAIDSMNCDSRAMCVAGDTVYYGKKIGNDIFLVAQKVVNNAFVFLDTIKLTMTWGTLSFSEIFGISVENGVIAVGYGAQFALFRWNGSDLQTIFTDFKPTQRVMDIVLKNNYVYVADRFYGMKVYDVASQTQAVLVAESKGTGGWTNVFGSTAITVGDDGQIFLCDFHAGVIIIEPFDHSLIGVEEKAQYTNDFFTIFPNPASDFFTIKINDADNAKQNTIVIYDVSGKEIFKKIMSGKSIEINTKKWSKGLYFVKLTDSNNLTQSRRIIVK
ncbi:MAG: hypothetical protein A2309_12000 [Bacteroidetes bacterium RIFOXYB2_FULL_35_7]|nr:MAG: hypothetical protein A2X01_05025 [Bacteroidetes bacterium GWF2_35_48]OFY92695.1 MAG: hypothetical protein A2491_13605 [Bacteroidetes bacterium RIFOXYC12_FULL_35_7]OFY97207.1 MAG: hypothetical protein A2309_12000 [Bacteroidetes bacterium RIFOXYB2_FULL_35_7]HBX52946.1 hypothetical protein [Bacteroidales bacterium]